LLAGPKGSPVNVVDILGVELNIFAAWGPDWTVPNNIPVGQYHYRVNVTNATSVLSDTFNITAGSPDCTPPAPWTNIASTSDPNYRSIHIDSPAGGDAVEVPGEIVATWYNIDGRNDNGAGIGNITLEFVNYKTGQATGLQVLENEDSTTFPFDGTAVSVGLWRLRANYSNKFEGSPPGTPVSTYSDVFVVFDDLFHKCAADGASSSGGSKSGGSRRLRAIPTAWLVVWVTLISLYR